MKRGMSLPLRHSLSLSIQSVWWNVNKSGSLCSPRSLPACLPSFLRPTRRRLRAPPHIRDAVHHARPQFAVRKVPCRPRAAPLLQVHIGGVGAENGPANSISQKRALSLAVHPLVSGYFPSRPFPFLPRRLPCSDRRSTTTRACLAATES